MHSEAGILPPVDFAPPTANGVPASFASPLKATSRPFMPSASALHEALHVKPDSQSPHVSAPALVAQYRRSSSGRNPSPSRGNDGSPPGPSTFRSRSASTGAPIANMPGGGQHRMTPPPRTQGSMSPPRRHADDEHAQSLYKTEYCRSWAERGSCRYGAKCQFAHGKEELRDVQRHPKYKTEICRSFWSVGTCPYGTRCRFIHRKADDKLQGASPLPPLTPIDISQEFPSSLVVESNDVRASTSPPGQVPALPSPLDGSAHTASPATVPVPVPTSTPFNAIPVGSPTTTGSPEAKGSPEIALRSPEAWSSRPQASNQEMFESQTSGDERSESASPRMSAASSPSAHALDAAGKEIVSGRAARRLPFFAHLTVDEN